MALPNGKYLNTEAWHQWGTKNNFAIEVKGWNPGSDISNNLLEDDRIVRSWREKIECMVRPIEQDEG